CLGRRENSWSGDLSRPCRQPAQERQGAGGGSHQELSAHHADDAALRALPLGTVWPTDCDGERKGQARGSCGAGVGVCQARGQSAADGLKGCRHAFASRPFGDRRFFMVSPADFYSIPLDDWINVFVRDWLVPNFRPFFRAIQWPITQVLEGLDAFLQAVPMVVFTLAMGAIAWRTAGRGVAIFTLLALSFVDMIGLWPETMTTLAMVVTAVIFCTIIGVPLGILAARSDGFLAVLRPLLDLMQTIPPVVYRVPSVMLFGVGMVPGIIATIVFALPPIIRLTNLGIRNGRGDLIEAGHAFGST